MKTPLRLAVASTLALLSAAVSGVTLLPTVPAEPVTERLRALAERTSEPRQLAKSGIEHIVEGRYAEASRAFNSALQLSPSDSYLQLLNGLAYHLMAVAGDSDKYGLAEQGYLLAIKFDGSNWLARYYLGNLRLDRRQYGEAQAAFAEALLYADADPDILYQLAAASYYAGDPATAAAALKRLEAMKPDEPKVQRAMAVVMAALGRAGEADGYLQRYGAAAPDSRNYSRLVDRVRGWQRFHQSSRAEEAVPVQFTRRRPAPGEAESPASAPSPSMEAPAPALSVPVEPPPSEAPGERMVLVDVVILRTEDLIATRKGVNLLSSLRIQFGQGTTIPAYSKVVNVSNTPGTSDTTTITHAITIPALDYSLNIANANSSSNEILARPTIAALEGVKSEFFSGTSLTAAAVAQGSSGYGGSVQIDKEIGVKLAITPQVLGRDRIKMDVVAERTFLKTPSSDNTFQYKLETSKVTVNAQAVLGFGETLILSGLSEKETNRVRDGVPLLQDIPIIQYLFSRIDTSDFQRSVLILVTPRRAEHVYKEGNGSVVGSREGGALSELRARYTDWFRPYPNLASVFQHLGSSSLYREFRTGDVTLERWDKQATLQERLHQVVDFLYY